MTAAADIVVAIVVAGGDPVAPLDLAHPLPEGALVVAADSGARQAARLGLRVDVLVGDLDSLEPDEVAAAAAGGTHVERHRPDKDKTDLELALDVAVERGAGRIVVVAGRGGRLDHALGNLLVLASEAYASVEIDALVGGARVHVVRAGIPRRIPGRAGELVTLFAVNGVAEHVRTEGLAWALSGEDLRPGSSRGVSNVFVAEEARIAVGAGVVLAIVPGALADPAAFPQIPGGTSQP